MKGWLSLAGLILLSVAVAMIYIPAGLIVAGLSLLLVDGRML